MPIAQPGTGAKAPASAESWLTPRSAAAAKPAAPYAPTQQDMAYFNQLNQNAQNQTNETASLNAASGMPGSISSDMSDLAGLGMSPSDSKWLANWYQGEQDALKSPAQILSDFYATPIFSTYFPGVKAQMDSGSQNVMSLSDYVSFKQDVGDMAASMGLPKGFVSNADIGQMVASNMTLSDVGQRINAAQSAAQSANPDTLALLQKWYGVTPNNGGLAAYYLNPNHSLFTANGVENTFAAANIGAEAQQGGFKNLDQSQLLGVAQYGGTAASEKGNVAQASSELNLAGPGGARLSGTQLSQQELLGGNLGVGTAGATAGQEAIDITAAQKGATARFSTGGNYGTGNNANAGGATE